MFFISESPDAFVTLLHLMIKWDFVGNVDLRAMRPYSLFLSLLMLLWHCCPSVTKDSGDSGIKNKDSFPSNQHFQQSLIRTSGATVSQKHHETQELRTKTHCPQINISNKVTWCSNETLLEMLIWGQWVFVLNSLVSWCYCDTVAPDDQMRLCWKCWFEGNESLFLIPESPDAFVTLLHLMFKWHFVGNVDLRAMSLCS